MSNYRIKKSTKLNTYKAARENIRLNTNSICCSKSFMNEDEFISQLNEINYVNHFNSKLVGNKGKLIIKWWEN